MKRLYNSVDEWLRALSQSAYAVVLGVSGGVGVLGVGLLLSHELRILQALSMGLVLFGLEYSFGLHQTTDD